jgi:type IV secretion system protein VirD4
LRKFINNKYSIISIIFIVSILLFLSSNFILAMSLSFLKSLNKMSFNSNSISIKDAFHFQSRYKDYYLIVTAIIVLIDMNTVYKIKTNFMDINQGQKGTSEFTTLKELKKQYKAVPEKTETYSGGGGIVISRYKDKIYVDDSAVNNLIIGTSRSGKGETVIFPTIDVYSRANKQPSMIINDPKGELAAASFDTLKNRGYDIYILNLMDPDNSMSYQLLQIIIDAYKAKDYSTAQLLCNTLTYSLYTDPSAKDKFWQNSAKSLVNALILAITKDCIERNEEEKITMYTIANLLADLGSKEDDEGNNELDMFFRKRDDFDVAKMQYATSNFAKGTTRGGIFATAMEKLTIFTFDGIARMTSKNSCNLEDVGFGDKPIAIFMVTPDYDSSNHVIPSIFVRQLYFILAKKASLSPGRKCKREVVYLLDEAGNMPPIEGFANILTVCLGRNIRFNIIIQAYTQLEDLYGKAAYNTILNNCGNTIYILTSDFETAEKVSKSIGNKTQVNNSTSGRALSLKKSTTESVDRRPLKDANELMSLMEGESVVIRVLKRRDNKRNKIRSKPIYNTGETSLKFRYEYLNEDFDTDKQLSDLKIESKHRDVDIRSLIIKSDKNEEKELCEENVNVNEENKENVKDEEKFKTELTRQDKFLIQQILDKYEFFDFAGIDIINAKDDDIRNIIEEFVVLDHFSLPDNIELNRILRKEEC